MPAVGGTGTYGAKPEVPGKAQTQPKAKTEMLTVRATALGYYDHVRRRPEIAGRKADVFVIEAKDFSPTWMELVPEDTPTQVTGAQHALSLAHQETLQERARTALPAMTGTDRDVLG